MANQGPPGIRETVEQYVRLMTAGDAGAIAALYADDATIEDPVGAPAQRGREAILRWYQASAGKAKLELSGPIRVSGREAAFPLVATLGAPGAVSYLDIIDVMEFDEQGRITRMRAFWSADAIRKG